MCVCVCVCVYIYRECEYLLVRIGVVLLVQPAVEARRPREVAQSLIAHAGAQAEVGTVELGVGFLEEKHPELGPVRL